MKIIFVLQKGNGIYAYDAKHLNLDAAERLGCGKMKEDRKNLWLARNREGGKVGNVGKVG